MSNIPQLKDILLEDIKKGCQLNIMTSYFTLFGYNEIKGQLAQVDNVKLIINPNRYDSTGKCFETVEENSLKLNLDYAGIAKEFATWIGKNANVKKVKSQKIEGKMLSINCNNHYTDYITHSDFSAAGLGLLDKGGRIHINEKVEDKDRAKSLRTAFESIWSNTTQVEDIKAKILCQLKNIYEDKSPELLYFFTISHLFKSFLEDADQEALIEKRTGITETLIWDKLYDFQRDGVVGAINKIEKFGGCIIADSVGLGKTFEALAVIKYYELRNHKVLVLAPKKLRDNWMVYKLNDKRNPFAKERLFSYTLLNHTDLSRENGYSGDVDLSYVHWGNYDLVVIDESHNFRNASTGKDKMTRYEKMMKDIIQSGVKTKVLMLSATPVNKELNDIKNQIAFISEGRDNAFAHNAEIGSISNTLRKAQGAFNLWNKLPPNEQTTETLLDYLNWDYFKLLDSLTIARSRKHIEKYYGLEKIGKFPTRLTPMNPSCEIDLKRQFPSFASINEEIMRMEMCVYTPLEYVLPELKSLYAEKYDTKLEGKGSFKQADREFSLKALMKTNLLKRLESSIYAFDRTISYLIEGIQSVLTKLSEDVGFQISDYDSDAYWEDDEIEVLMIGNATKILVSDLDKIRFQSDLEYDLSILYRISEAIKKVTPERDEKMQQLMQLISDKMTNPINSGNKKIIVFTAFADTANYLYENLVDWAKSKFGIYTGLVTGSDDPKTNFPVKRKDFVGMLINFSPRSKERGEEGEEIDLLIATDCISEGQNLQDCDYLINYDIHWNPVRIIQRFGRIDRIGSKNDCIQLVNFWPAIGLDEYINLEQRVKGRMKLLDISATGEENIIESNPEMRDLEYRKNQLEQLKKEVLDIEDLAGGVSITDLTLNDFRMDLTTFLEKNPTVLSEIPTGVYAVSRNESDKLQDEIKPGVIFCLKSTDKISQDQRNSLAPYYLVYVSDDGEICFSEKQIKQVLDIYRALCLGRKEPIKELVTAFNKKSHNQMNMKHWKTLCSKAIDFVKDKEDDNCGDVFSLGGLSMFGSENSDIRITDNDYELISFLVIM
ncbi:helicase-related protein [Massilibacteroides vaginae]|uniref:helicase-related protein n=1 Tax=Massilibacteroides vaginae TaxID=1673718 RepID=UPI000A1CB038|nr:helicase-related protein [Massilibacteroides vaginae]